MTARAHHAALRARLEASPVLAGVIHDTVRRRSMTEFIRENYGVLWPTPPGALEPSRYTESADARARATYQFQFRAVAVDTDGCLLLADAAIEQTVGHELVVPGRYVWPLRLDEGGEVEHDPKADLYYCDLTFEAVSDPA